MSLWDNLTEVRGWKKKNQDQEKHKEEKLMEGGFQEQRETNFNNAFSFLNCGLNVFCRHAFESKRLYM